MMNRTKIFHWNITFAFLCALLSTLDTAHGAAVVSRNTRARRAPVTTTTTTTTQSTTTTATKTETPATESAPAEKPEIIIEDKTSQFSTALGNLGGQDIDTDASADSLAQMISRQRAALDSADAISAATAAAQSNANTCDMALRACMAEKCGRDFTKCSGDTDMTWGDKMDTCRRDTTCTGREYQLFAAEIKADRDLNAELSEYNTVIECGTSYNNCIINKCGATFGKCLGKSAGDKAISECKQIADRCAQSDNGLSARVGEVFATLRQTAEKQIATDEARLYELRDKMRSQCEMLGAMFDERTFDCVYTVNFFAADATTPYASKKAYGGTTFDCTQDWFGIDVTTFKENAYRYAREQASATSAMLGAGLGTAAGAITSGAIDRAIDTQRAKKALDAATDEHNAAYSANAESSDTVTQQSGKKVTKRSARKAAEATNNAPVAPIQDAPATFSAPAPTIEKPAELNLNPDANQSRTQRALTHAQRQIDAQTDADIDRDTDELLQTMDEPETPSNDNGGGTDA